MPDAAQPSVLRFENVTLRLDEDPVLDDVSFNLLAGESCVILGAAGSGKTVLLKTAIGLLRPDEGAVYAFGEDICRMDDRELVRIRSKIGILFQEGGLFDSLTIEENVSYPLLNQPGARWPKEEVLPRVEEALQFVELDHTLDKFPSELSGGMRRRVGIARANVNQPPLVLYDSPTAGLDPITAYTIMALIVKERDTKNTTTVMVTHQHRDGHVLANYRYNAKTDQVEAIPANGSRGGHSTRFLVLRAGKLVFEGSEEELAAESDPYLRMFVRNVEN